MKEAAALIEQHAEGRPLITETRALGKAFGPFDVALLVRACGGALRMLYFDVDCETHEEQCHDTGPAQQWVRDRRKDKAAWRAGLMLVRLHYSDKTYWGDTIMRAVGIAQQQRPHRLLWYTKHHGLRGKQRPL